MITLNASGGSITFEFSGNSTYLNDGTITVPVNSLALIIDESNMATFKKAASNDIFVSANVSEFGMTKAELESWFKENMVGSTGGGDITSGEVQTMIDESISGKADSSAVEQELATKLDSSAYTPVQVSSAITENDANAVAGGAVYDKVHVTSGETSATTIGWYSGDDGAYAGNFHTGATKFTIEFGSNFSSAGIYFGNEGWMYISKSNDDVTVSFEDVSGATSYTDNVLNVEIFPANDIIYLYTNSAPSNIKFTLNVIEGESVEYWIKDYVDAKVAEVGGGKAIEAGRGISVATGETADTVSFNLPISAGTGTNSIAEGDYATARGNYSHAEGQYAKANGESSHAEGYGSSADGIHSHAEGMLTVVKGNSAHAEGNGTIANNQAEHASGLYNVSNSLSTTFGDSGNTLFSVGNGRADNARHNAFEIRQNGDIYFFDGTNDVKLQDVISNILNRLTALENNS